MNSERCAPGATAAGSAGLLSTGLLCGFLVSYGWAGISPPTEHKGLEVENLGVITEESMSAQLGLENHKLQLREITIEPGGRSPGTATRHGRGWSR